MHALGKNVSMHRIDSLLQTANPRIYASSQMSIQMHGESQENAYILECTIKTFSSIHDDIHLPKFNRMQSYCSFGYLDMPVFITVSITT